MNSERYRKKYIVSFKKGKFIAFFDSHVMEVLWYSDSQWNNEIVVLANLLKDRQEKLTLNELKDYKINTKILNM